MNKIEIALFLIGCSIFAFSMHLILYLSDESIRIKENMASDVGNKNKQKA